MSPTVSAIPWAVGTETITGDGIGFFDLAASLIALTSLFAYLNHRVLRLPPSIGVMALALAFSLAVIGIGLFIPFAWRPLGGDAPFITGLSVRDPS